MMDTPIHWQKGDYVFEHKISEICDTTLHFHDSYEIFQACSDNIHYFVEGTVYNLDEGDILITNMKEIHGPQLINNNPYNRRYIQFRGIAFTPFFNTDYSPLAIFDNHKLGQGNRIPLQNKNDNKINHILDEIERLNGSNSQSDQLLQKTMIVELLIQLDKEYKRLNESFNYTYDLDQRIVHILHYLNDHFECAMNLEDLAKRTYMDKYYLSHLFKKNTGFTIYEYIQTKRIQHAKKLISEGIPISEACRLCGYNDYSNFYKTYKKLTGISPKKQKNCCN